MAVGFDQDRTFMLVEVADHDLYFKSISRLGRIVDSGVFPNMPDPKRSSDASPFVHR
jgi:hypothetical protein